MMTKKELYINVKEQIKAINELDFYTYYDIINNHFIIHGYKDKIKQTFDIPLQYFKGDNDSLNVKLFSIFFKDKDGEYTEIKTNNKYRKDYFTYKTFKSKKYSLLNNNTNKDQTAFLNMNEIITTFTDIFKTNIDKEHIYLPKIAKFDIETDDEKGAPFDNLDNPINEIHTIVVYNNYDDKIYVFSYKDWNFDFNFDVFMNELQTNTNFLQNKQHNQILDRLKTLQSRTVKIVTNNEIEMLQSFLKHLRKEKYDIYCGWNSQSFDLPYIYKRIAYLVNEAEANKLSPYNVVKINRSVDSNNLDDVSYKLNIKGIDSIDYMLLFKQMILGNRESFSLENISQEELGVGKLKFEETTYTKFYNTNINKHILYNIIDVIWIDEIDRKLKMIYLNMLKAFEGLMSFERTVTNVSLVHQNAIYKMLIQDKLVYANDHPEKIKQSYQGGYCDAHPGFYKYLICKDFTSLYPSIMMVLNLSVETILSNDDISNMKPDDIITTLDNNLQFTKQFKGIITKYTENNFLKRLKYKQLMKTDGNNKEQWNLYQYATKILINSLYGFMGYKHSYFYNLKNASIITRTARHLIKLMSSVITDLHNDYTYLNKYYNFKKYKLTYNNETNYYSGFKTIIVKRNNKKIKTLIKNLKQTDEILLLNV